MGTATLAHYAIVSAALCAAPAGVLTPMFAGWLVDAIASGAASKAIAWRAATIAFGVLAALGLGAMLLRQVAFADIVVLTLKMMSGTAANAFHRVQRFSTD